MHIGAFRIWCRHIREMENVWDSLDELRVYRRHNDVWFDEEDLPLTDGVLGRRLDDRRQKDVHWRPKRDFSRPEADKLSYFPVRDFDAVIEARFHVPTRSERRRSIQKRVLDIVKVARYEFGATHHDLTGLPNRQRLSDIVHDFLPSGEVFDYEQSEGIASTYRLPTMSLISIDIDDFKQVNDSYGHQYGDVVLRCVGSRLKEVERELR